MWKTGALNQVSCGKLFYYFPKKPIFELEDNTVIYKIFKYSTSKTLYTYTTVQKFGVAKILF